jgi:hypothetical protein
VAFDEKLQPIRDLVSGRLLGFTAAKLRTVLVALVFAITGTVLVRGCSFIEVRSCFG